MGGGSYSTITRSKRALASGFETKSRSEIFTQKCMNNSMDPSQVSIRESRDSEEHPNSLAIVLGLDVTGSMGHIPHYLVREGLPKFVSKVIQNGEPDPQVLFLAIGDHECDNSPLQVSQFESSDELMDKWLTEVYLEGGGGGNAGESYLLAWYFAAYHTSIDCFEKRKRKGCLITIGDEPFLEDLPSEALRKIMGPNQYNHFTAKDLFEKASKKYNVYHIHIERSGHSTERGGINIKNQWQGLMGDNLIIVNNQEEVVDAIADRIITGTPTTATNESVKTDDDFEFIK